MQVDPIKPMLKAPRIKRLKLKYDEPPSNCAFKFNVRRYTEARMQLTTHLEVGPARHWHISRRVIDTHLKKLSLELDDIL